MKLGRCARCSPVGRTFEFWKMVTPLDPRNFFILGVADERAGGGLHNWLGVKLEAQ